MRFTVLKTDQNKIFSHFTMH